MSVCFWEDGVFYGEPYEMRPVKPYVPDSGRADMEFVREMMDAFQPGGTKGTMEEGLKRIGRYFQCEEAYILERKSAGTDYHITWGMAGQGPMVHNHNLKMRIPGLVRSAVFRAVLQPGGSGLQPDL